MVKTVFFAVRIIIFKMPWMGMGFKAWKRGSVEWMKMKGWGEKNEDKDEEWE